MAIPFRPIADSPMPDINVVIPNSKSGTIKLVDQTRLPPNASKESINVIQVDDGRWRTRWGSADYGAEHDEIIDGASEFVVYSNDGTVTTEIITASDGKIWKSTDGGSLTQITNGVYTAGSQVNMKQLENYLYIVTGVDQMMRYDGSTIQTYAAISAPVAVSAVKTGLSNGSYNAYYRVVAVNEVGYTLPSAQMTVASGINKQRRSGNWTSGSEYVTVTWTAPVTNAADVVRYEIYYSDRSGFEVYLDSVNAGVLSYRDTGEPVPNPYIDLPTDNSTEGPYVKSLCSSGNRIWGTNDPQNPYKVYWAGTGAHAGRFAPSLGGGWVELDYGSKEKMVAVHDFKDGKGDASAIVFTTDPEGNGSMWTIQLNTRELTADIAIVEPMTQRVVGSIGTNAPRSVVQADNKVFYFNSKGWFNTGTKPSLLNVLSTDEVSVNIRPYIQELRALNIDKACAYYYDGKLFCSAPHDNDINDQIYILDIERKNWNVYWTIGATQFLEYTESNGNRLFLFVSPTSKKLQQLSPSIKGDNGEPFYTSVVSALMPIIERDRTKPGKINYGYLELGNASGQIQFEVYGEDRRKGYMSLAQRTISLPAGRGSSGMGFDLFGQSLLGSSEGTPSTITTPTITKSLKVNKRVYSVQFRVSSYDLNTEYTILRQQAKGFLIPSKDPTSYKQ